MISFLTGVVAGRFDTFALLDVGGVGFRLNMSSRSLAVLPASGDEVTVHTYLHVREDELTLYGFESAFEREAFEALISVTGVGPKVALSTLSFLSPEELVAAIASEDVALISSVPGVGRKTAGRVVLDLAERLGADRVGRGGAGRVGPGAVAEAREALLAMGFVPAEASAALKGAPADEDVQTVLAYALSRLGDRS